MDCISISSSILINIMQYSVFEKLWLVMKSIYLATWNSRDLRQVVQTITHYQKQNDVVYMIWEHGKVIFYKEHIPESQTNDASTVTN